MNWLYFAILLILFVILYLTLLPSLVLKQVNKVREEEGLPLLSDLFPGIRDVSNCCPLALSLPNDPWVHGGTLDWVQIGIDASSFEKAWGKKAALFGSTMNGRLDFIIKIPFSLRVFQRLFDTGWFYRRYNVELQSV